MDTGNNNAEPEQEVAALQPNFRRWALEMVALVVLALLVFAGAALLVTSLKQGDEVTPGRQLEDMIEQDNGSRGRLADEA